MDNGETTKITMESTAWKKEIRKIRYAVSDNKELVITRNMKLDEEFCEKPGSTLGCCANDDDAADDDRPFYPYTSNKIQCGSAKPVLEVMECASFLCSSIQLTRI